MEGATEQVDQVIQDTQQKVDWQIDADKALQIKDRVSKAASFLNKSGVPWYLVGGLGVELSNGVVTRDHPDTDIAIFRDDMGTFYDYVAKKGGRVFRSLSKEQFDEYKKKFGREPEIKYQDGIHTQAYIGSKEELVQDTYSPFVSFEGGEVDLDIIDVDPVTDEVPLLGSTGIKFSKSQYSDPETVEINGEKVILSPQEITITHKIIQGREKDRLDLVNTTSEVRDKVEKRIADAGLNFKLNNGTTTEHIQDLINQSYRDNPNSKIWAVVEKKRKLYKMEK